MENVEGGRTVRGDTHVLLEVVFFTALGLQRWLCWLWQSNESALGPRACQEAEADRSAKHMLQTTVTSSGVEGPPGSSRFSSSHMRVAMKQ